jgi:hypothetical protein
VCLQANPVKQISHNPDFSSLLPVGNELFMVTQFESPEPASMYVLSLTQDKASCEALARCMHRRVTSLPKPPSPPAPLTPKPRLQLQSTGKLGVTRMQPVDLSGPAGGAWIMCAGSVSPWNSHLGGEEYEPDARAFEAATELFKVGNSTTSLQTLDPGSFSAIVEKLRCAAAAAPAAPPPARPAPRCRSHPAPPSLRRFWGLYADASTSMAQVRELFNPYRYGATIEVKVKPGGAYTAKKWFTTGRNAKELVYVMPDRKTIYITDDGERVGFYKMVLDYAEDMSSGTIYAAKMTQMSAANGGTFSIEWIRMGYATQGQLEVRRGRQWEHNVW